MDINVTQHFTIEEMMRLMNCGNKKINELLKELEN